VRHARAPLSSGDDTDAAKGNGAKVATTWWKRAGRLLRNAAVGLALLTALPVGLLTMVRDNFLFVVFDAQERVVDMDHLRALRVPIDAAMSPAAAGEALGQLFPVAAQRDFVPRVAGAPGTRPAEAMTAIAFPQGPVQQWWGPQHALLIRRAAEGLPVAEQAVLQRIANAPVWRTMDMVARAPWADVVGGRFETPFSTSATSMAMPMPYFMDIKVMGYAGVSRAAYYVSQRDYVRAEAALRTVLSVGFLLIDNGTSVMDALTGRLVVNTAREGLEQLYAVSGDQGMAANGAVLVKGTGKSKGMMRDRRAGQTFERVRAQQLQDIRNPALPRSLRFSQLDALQWSSCASLREVFLGPSADVQAANAYALRELARTPAERDYVRLASRALANAPYVPRALASSGSPPHGPLEILGATGVAQIVSTVTGKPQLATCTGAILGMGFGR
jgi:hypothetical protein